MSTITAGTATTNPVVITGDTTGTLILKTNDTGSGGTTAVTIGTDQSVNFPATGQRITGDFTNATVTNRVMFQTSTANSTTGIYALPSGTSTAASWQATNNATPTNCSKILIATNGSTDVQLVSGINGSGTYLPMTFYNNGSEKLRLDTSGNFLIGTATSPAGSSELVLGGDYIEGVVAIGNSGTSKTISLASGTFQTVTMTGNCTFTMPTAVAGKSFILIVSTGAGGFTGTFTSVKWPSNTAPTLTTTASRWDILSFMSDGTNWYGAFQQAYQ